MTLFAPPSAIARQRAQFAIFRDDYLPRLPEDLHELVFYSQWCPEGPESACLVPGEDAVAMWHADAAIVARIRRLKRFVLNAPSIPGDDHAAALEVAGACFPTARALGILRVDVVEWALEW